MRGGLSGGLDRFRAVAALLVVAVHTGPLLSLSASANYLVTDILARLAVPFFFAVSGFFLVPKLEERGGLVLWPFLRKVLFLYGTSLLIYLPLLVRNGYFQGPDLAGKLLRDLIFDGPFYHLWYFPAAMVGGALVTLLVRKLGLGGALAVSAVLYLLGLLGDSYYGFAAALPPLATLYGGLFQVFGYTRNGLFLAPIFLLLGGLWARRGQTARPARYATGFFASLALLIGEGFIVKGFSLARHDSMYLLLPLCLWLLMGWLVSVKAKPLPWMRRLTTVVYIIHPWCIVLVRGLGKTLGLLSGDGFLLGSSLVHYLAVVALSCLIAFPFLFLRQKPSGSAPKDRAWAEVDLDALEHNVDALSALLPPGCALMAVVKADAYGHGDLTVARSLWRKGVRAFAVATAEEGARLRRGGIRGEVLVLGWTPPEAVSLLARCRLTQAVTSAEHAAALKRAGRRIKVHLALDTGMHRLGIPWDDADALKTVYACRHLRVEGVFTHLSAAETLSGTGQAATRQQLCRFGEAVRALRDQGLPTGKLHVQSSYGLLNHRDASPLPCAYARMGIALYGLLSSQKDRTHLDVGLRPVLSLKARVARVQDIAAGGTAGYDGAFTARRPSRLATLTIGYADGWPRCLSGGRGGVLIGGRYAPVAGLICMDQMLVDVTDIPGVEMGDVATLIGRDGDARRTAGQVAAEANTIPNELLSRLGPRIPRVTVRSGSQDHP